jgi:hypothetical protein
MPTKKAEWFIVERVHALAVMHLTRRRDLVIRDEPRDPAYFPVLAVEIIEPEKVRPGHFAVYRWQFDVYLDGTRTAIDEDQANKLLSPSFREFNPYHPVAHPICLFYFTMEDDQGYFTWVKEPKIEVDGKAKLFPHREAHCIKLDRKVLDRIVHQVCDWYDALNHSLTVN